jgi:hypothetical protein
VHILHDIPICEEAASECLPYARTDPKIEQISQAAFLKSRDWLLKCVSLESADFQMFPSYIDLKLNIFFSMAKF